MRILLLIGIFLLGAGTAAAEPFAMRCMPGGKMQIYVDMHCLNSVRIDGPRQFFAKDPGHPNSCWAAPRLWFEPAPAGADAAPLKPGQCAWPHRALNKAERAGANAEGLVPIHMMNGSMHGDKLGLIFTPDGDVGYRDRGRREPWRNFSDSTGDFKAVLQRMRQQGKPFTMQVSWRSYQNQAHYLRGGIKSQTARVLWVERVY